MRTSSQNFDVGSEIAAAAAAAGGVVDDIISMMPLISLQVSVLRRRVVMFTAVLMRAMLMMMMMMVTRMVTMPMPPHLVTCRFCSQRAFSPSFGLKSVLECSKQYTGHRA